MFGKKALALAGVFCLLIGCAKSNYQDDRQAHREEKPGQADGTQPGQAGHSPAGLGYQITWEKMPTESEVGSFQIQFSQDLQQAPTVLLWMPDMGHGSSPVKVEELSKSLYRVQEVFFVMPGAWQIKIQVKNGSSVDEIIQNIQI